MVIKRPPRGDRGAGERLDREIILCSRLQHPHVIRVLDARRARPGADPYLVLERARRGTLAQYRSGEGPAGLVQALLDALAGLGHLHARGLLHLDIKPANLFVSEAPDGVRVKVGDLGSAVHRWGLGSPEIRGLVGTTGYLAPEIRARDLSSLGPWTDLWSLGATARVLAGSGPPAWLLPWLDRCTADAPADRFGSALQAARALRGLPASRAELARFTEPPRGIFSFLDHGGSIQSETRSFEAALAPVEGGAVAAPLEGPDPSLAPGAAPDPGAEAEADEAELPKAPPPRAARCSPRCGRACTSSGATTPPPAPRRPAPWSQGSPPRGSGRSGGSPSSICMRSIRWR